MLFSREQIVNPQIISSSDPNDNLLVLSPPSRVNTAQAILINTISSARAGGQDGFKLIETAKDNALTGTSTAINARTNNSVASSTGKIVGVKSYAANNNASSALTVHGAEIWALTKGVAAGTVRGAEIGLDFDGGETADEAVVARLVSQAGGTVTRHYGLQVVDDSGSTPGGRAYDSFIKLEKTAGELPKSVLYSDFAVYAGTSANGITLTSGDVPLFSYKDKDGTAHVLVMANDDTVAIRT
jgi:hypothetical protein